MKYKATKQPPPTDLHEEYLSGGVPEGFDVYSGFVEYVMARGYRYFKADLDGTALYIRIEPDGLWTAVHSKERRPEYALIERGPCSPHTVYHSDPITESEFTKVLTGKINVIKQ